MLFFNGANFLNLRRRLYGTKALRRFAVESEASRKGGHSLEMYH